MKNSRVNWDLSNHCTFGCIYCPSRFSGGSVDQPVDSYVNAVKLIQDAMHGHVDQINWNIRGGEPLMFPGVNLLLKEIKNRPSRLELHTSGGDNWFDLLAVADYIDKLNLTIHYWQNSSVTNFILDQLKGKLMMGGVINIPLHPGKITECKEYIKELKSMSFSVKEVILRDSNLLNYWEGYSQSDINLIEGRRADEDPVKYEVKYDVKQTAEVIPDSTFVDLSKPPVDDSPSMTGQPCYAGIDYMEIDNRGFVNGSRCRGRTMGNIFDPGWKPEYQPFACPMLFCRESEDRNNIRMGQ